MQTILFVCSGNIFRSMTAEFGLRQSLGASEGYEVRSAGITAKPQEVHPAVRQRLAHYGISVDSHLQRKLTADILEEAALVVAMSTNHQDFLREQFQYQAPLFNEVCHGRSEPLLDIHEVLADWESRPEESARYAEAVVDQILDSVDQLAPQLERLLTPRLPESPRRERPLEP